MRCMNFVVEWCVLTKLYCGHTKRKAANIMKKVTFVETCRKTMATDGS